MQGSSDSYPPRFLVRYCQNWDGGEQERQTATDAILAVVPDAVVESKRIDSYPVRVEIFYLGRNEQIKPLEIWQGPQRNLFRKYAQKREESILDIQYHVEKTIRS